MENVQKKLLKILKSDEADAAVTVISAGVSVVNPLTRLFFTAVQQIGNLADEIRIDAVVRGLSTELNQEKQINQLYGYGEKSEENAFYVVNTLRKALLTNSLIACTIMGRILACHAIDASKYNQDDDIIFHALENATDDDSGQAMSYKDMEDALKGIITPYVLNKCLSDLESWGFALTTKQVSAFDSAGYGITYL